MVDEQQPPAMDETQLDAEFDTTPKRTDYGMVQPVRITEEMERSYLNYAMSVIVSRALPDVRDGLKPVHRRILYAMQDMGITHSAGFKKCARIVGEVLGKYHPHGDTAVYDALVRLAQDFSMRYPLVHGQGNFGSVDGDSAAAMRYTEAKLAKITKELLVDIDKRTVPFIDTFDGSQQEPTVLPAKLPNLLLAGSEGIAVGMATKIPPHNLTEVIEATKLLIRQGSSPKAEIPAEIVSDTSLAEALARAGGSDQVPLQTDGKPNIALIPAEHLTGAFTSDATIEQMLEYIQGPDFPTGGIIYDWNSIKQVYLTGKGRVVTRGVAEIVEAKNGKSQIHISELPFQVNKAKLVSKIADLVRNKKIKGISDLRDESDRKGMAVVVDLKRDARPKSVLNNLYKYTDLQTSFPANIVALNSEGTPHVMNLKTILTEYVKHRQLVVVRRSQHELLSAQERAHILEGLLIALDHLDEVITLIRNSPDVETARTALMERFKLSHPQATAILDMQLRKLAALERKKIEEEYAEIKATIDRLTGLIRDPQQILNLIVSEMDEIQQQYGDERKTKLVKSKVGEIAEEDLIKQEDVIVTMTESGYIKRILPSSYRTQRRGGKGVSGMTTKEGDAVTHILAASTHDNLLIFTNKGKVFKLKVWELPEGSRQAKGQAIINLISIEQGEEIQSIIPVSSTLADIQDKYIALATKNGIVKKTAVSEFQNIRTSGIIAIILNDGDHLVWGDITEGKRDILLVTHEGKSIRFSEKQIRSTARDTKGVKGISLSKDDYVIAVESIDTEFKEPEDKRRRYFHDLLVITEKGMGKRTPFDEYPSQKRGGQGVKVANVSTKSGMIAAALAVTQLVDQVIITTKEAQIIKLPIKNIPQLKRPTQGVIMMRFAKSGDSVVAAAAVENDEEEV